MKEETRFIPQKVSNIFHKLTSLNLKKKCGIDRGNSKRHAPQASRLLRGDVGQNLVSMKKEYMGRHVTLSLPSGSHRAPQQVIVTVTEVVSHFNLSPTEHIL